MALYAKVHVAAIDDTTGAELMTSLLDSDGAAGRAVAVAEPDDVGSAADPGPLDVLARLVGPLPDQLRWAAGFPGRLAERSARAG